ncbi:MAG: glutathione S-transferase family protein [Burkholderiaceae bacterium]
MKLHFALASPFARKVRVCAAELGLDDKIELLPVQVAPGKPNPEYSGHFNPLRKIPSLTLNDGSTLFDSAVICEYLDNQAGGNKLLPGSGDPKRWQVLTDHALADGMTELAILLRYETMLRPEQYRWPLWIEDHWEKIDNGLDWLDKRLDASDESFGLGRIALACLLGYLDFRFAEHDWRKDHGLLSDWYEQMAQRPSMLNTRPQA